MAKEVMIVTPEEFANLVPSAKAMDAYKFAIAHAGVEMDDGAVADFVSIRNLKTEGFRDLDEVQKRIEKLLESIKAAKKFAFSIGSEEDLPANVKWSKQSFTYGWNEGAARVVAEKMIESNLCTAEQLFDQVTVTGLCKACGITTEKLLDMFEGAVELKPKERTLSIK